MSTAFAPTRYKLSIEDFEKLRDAGIFCAARPVELIEGELIESAPPSERHLELLQHVEALLQARVAGQQVSVSSLRPVRLPPRSMPTPDLLLATGCERQAPLHANQVLLAIEIADHTLELDREVKLPLYARHGVAELWLMHVNARALEVYRDPGARGYRRKLEPALSDTVAPAGLPELRIALADLLR